jgi:hypothetical protein
MHYLSGCMDIINNSYMFLIFYCLKGIDMEEKADTMPVMQPPVKPPIVATGYESDDIQELAEKMARLTGSDAKELEMYLAGKIVSKKSKNS